MNINSIIKENTAKALKALFGADVKPQDVSINETRKEFEGDATVLVFPFVRVAKKKPEEAGEMIGAYLLENVTEVTAFNVVKGFLNLSISNAYWLNFFKETTSHTSYGKLDATGKNIVLEYCGPNTNKPLHLGHIRNMLLGYATANLLEAAGNEVHKVNIYNDRGIAICKSMLAWQKFGNGETPESTGMKGDHFAGKYYVLFDQKHKEQLLEIEAKIVENQKLLSNDEEIDKEDSTQLIMLAVIVSVLIVAIVLFYKNKEKEVSKEDKTLLSLFFASLSIGAGAGYLVNKKLEENKDRLDLLEDDIKELKQNNTIKELINSNEIAEAKRLFEKYPNAETSLKDLDKDGKKEFFAAQKKLNGLTELMQEAQEMLRQWEAGNKEVLSLWNKMNNWVYEGFETTFKNIGVEFEKHYKESDYYIKGKDFVLEGVDKGIFHKKDDGAVFVDLTDEGLDEKILVRSDGTSVYITQDMGIAQARYEDYKFDQMIYVVGQEQDYHFQVLKEVIKKLGNDYSDSIMHFSYGMVSLPEGKMKSREGTVVDADDLIASMIETATEHTAELGKVDDLAQEEVAELNRKIALAALKFFILKVNPKKGVMFNPKESIDFQGNTGPFIQYTYTRIQSMTRSNEYHYSKLNSSLNLEDAEKDLIKELHKLPLVIASAASNYDVSELTSYIYSIAKAYNKMYAAVSILKAETEELKNFRLCLSDFTGKILKQNLEILGIEVPDRM